MTCSWSFVNISNHRLIRRWHRLVRNAYWSMDTDMPAVVEYRQSIQHVTLLIDLCSGTGNGTWYLVPVGTVLSSKVRSCVFVDCGVTVLT